MPRRLAAIFAADVKGFARLTDADEVGTLKALASQRAILDSLITRYHGRIPGTTKPARLDENLGAASLQLDTHDLREIEDASAAIKVQGARYPEELLKMTGL
jgi:diketogulonate reductase-like aldo/keto reductase